AAGTPGRAEEPDPVVHGFARVAPASFITACGRLERSSGGNLDACTWSDGVAGSYCMCRAGYPARWRECSACGSGREFFGPVSAARTAGSIDGWTLCGRLALVRGRALAGGMQSLPAG